VWRLVVLGVVLELFQERDDGIDRHLGVGILAVGTRTTSARPLTHARNV